MSIKTERGRETTSLSSCISSVRLLDKPTKGGHTVMISQRKDPLVAALQTNRAFQEQYQQVRRFTEQLCAPLVAEDYVIQSMPDVSPTKWHIAHVTWFWETFLLSPAIPNYQSFHPNYAYLFNSYYNTLGQR